MPKIGPKNFFAAAVDLFFMSPLFSEKCANTHSRSHTRTNINNYSIINAGYIFRLIETIQFFAPLFVFFIAPASRLITVLRHLMNAMWIYWTNYNL